MLKYLLIFGLVLTGCSQSNQKDSNNEGPMIEVNLDALINQDLSQAPAQVNLGTTTATIREVSEVLSLKNNTASPVNLNIAIDLENYLDVGFKVKLNRCPSSLLPGKSCQVTVSFSNRSTFNGGQVGGLIINPGMTIQLAASVTERPNPSTEGTVIIGLSLNPAFSTVAASQYRTLTVTNSGTGEAKNLSINIDPKYSIRINRCPQNLGSNKSCTIQLVFRNNRNEQPTAGSIAVSATTPGNSPVEPINLDLLTGQPEDPVNPAGPTELKPMFVYNFGDGLRFARLTSPVSGDLTTVTVEELNFGDADVDSAYIGQTHDSSGNVLKSYLVSSSFEPDVKVFDIDSGDQVLSIPDFYVDWRAAGFLRMRNDNSSEYSYLTFSKPQVNNFTLPAPYSSFEFMLENAVYEGDKIYIENENYNIQEFTLNSLGNGISSSREIPYDLENGWMKNSELLIARNKGGGSLTEQGEMIIGKDIGSGYAFFVYNPITDQEQLVSTRYDIGNVDRINKDLYLIQAYDNVSEDYKLIMYRSSTKIISLVEEMNPENYPTCADPNQMSLWYALPLSGSDTSVVVSYKDCMGATNLGQIVVNVDGQTNFRMRKVFGPISSTLRITKSAYSVGSNAYVGVYGPGPSITLLTVPPSDSEPIVSQSIMDQGGGLSAVHLEGELLPDGSSMLAVMSTRGDGTISLAKINSDGSVQQSSPGVVDIKKTLNWTFDFLQVDVVQSINKKREFGTNIIY